MRAALVTVLTLVAFGVQAGVVAAAPDESAAQRILVLTNAERQKAGLLGLSLNPALNDAAQTYTDVLASGDCFAHTCGPVPDLVVRIELTGYLGWTSIGENIAAGYPTPEAVVAGWMGSAGHRRNILTASFTEMGVGAVSGTGRYGTYWAQEFGNALPADGALDSSASE